MPSSLRSGRATALAALALAVPACGDGPAEEDLPAGAFTSGPQIDTFDDLGIDGTSEAGDGMPDDGTTNGVDPDTGGSETAMMEGTTGAACEIPADLSHEVDIAPIWLGSCAVAASCHVSGGTQVPDLETDPLQTLTDGMSPVFAVPFLTAGDSSNSYVYLKIADRQSEVGGGGGAMPIAPGEITDCERQIIEAWIDQGAAP